MGQRQDQTEIVYGDDCLIGFDPGKTPKCVYARFSKMVKCPDVTYAPPNDRVFKLTQAVANPCLWVYYAGGWLINFTIVDAPLRTNIFLYNDFEELDYFSDTPEGPVEEGYVYHNDLEACNAIHAAHHGIAVVTWRLETIALMKVLNIEPAYDLFMEMRPLDDGNKVYKYCKLKDGTNIAIEFESD
ncbi:hypothetical protein ES708_11968 [subsurface metagenome]